MHVMAGQAAKGAAESAAPGGPTEGIGGNVSKHCKIES